MLLSCVWAAGSDLYGRVTDASRCFAAIALGVGGGAAACWQRNDNLATDGQAPATKLLLLLLLL